VAIGQQLSVIFVGGLFAALFSSLDKIDRLCKEFDRLHVLLLLEEVDALRFELLRSFDGATGRSHDGDGPLASLYWSNLLFASIMHLNLIIKSQFYKTNFSNHCFLLVLIKMCIFIRYIFSN
jgi:hypothetical protein